MVGESKTRGCLFGLVSLLPSLGFTRTFHCGPHHSLSTDMNRRVKFKMYAGLILIAPPKSATFYYQKGHEQQVHGSGSVMPFLLPFKSCTILTWQSFAFIHSWYYLCHSLFLLETLYGIALQGHLRHKDHI